MINFLFYIMWTILSIEDSLHFSINVTEFIFFYILLILKFGFKWIPLIVFIYFPMGLDLFIICLVLLINKSSYIVGLIFLFSMLSIQKEKIPLVPVLFLSYILSNKVLF